MNSTFELPEVRAYLEKLQRLLADLPDREAVLDDITLHIETAAAHAPGDSGLVRQILDELGDPATIAASASSPPTDRTARPLLRHGGVIAVVLLLALGGLAIPTFGWGVALTPLPALAWLIGFVLLWTTKDWTILDKAIGTFTIPVIFATAFLIEKLAFQTDPNAAVDIAVITGYAALTVAVSIYLLLRYRPLPR